MFALIVRIFRIAIFYALFFLLSMILVVSAFRDWPAGAQMLFAFFAPAAVVWAMDMRRQKRRQLQAVPKAEDTKSQSQRLAQDDTRAQETRREERNRLPISLNEERQTTNASTSPPISSKQDNSALIEAARVRRERLEAEPLQAKPKLKPETEAHGKSPAEPIVRGRTGRLTSPWEKLRPKAGAKTTRSARRLQGWVSKDDPVALAGRDIGGMIYVGTPPRLNNYGYRDKSRPYIDPSLPVATSGTDREGNEMPYWPGYSDISPVCRATYLDWLADGRRDARYNPGYMFLYFYGLERRFMVDQAPEDEKRDILAEVQRLAALYSEDSSVRRYLGQFLQIAQVAVQDAAATEPIFEYHGWELPFGLKVAIGAMIAQEEPLGWDWTLSWLICHPDHYLRTPATRCPEEFRALFRLRFDARYPDGLKVTKPRKLLKGEYKAASGEFQATLTPQVNGKPVPDILGVRTPVQIARKIADEVTEALDKFSRYLGRNPEGRDSLEAQALLPMELRALFPSEELERLKDWARSATTGGGLVPAGDVITRLEGVSPEKLTKSQLTGAADTLARIGFGLAPDPRFALRSPRIDEPLMIFDLESPIEKLEDVSSAYRAALLELALGAFVVHADGVISETERQALARRIDETTGISGPERVRLRANMEWFLTVPPDMPLLRRKLKETGPEAQAALRSALIAAAHADGVIQSEEVAGIEKLYKAIGLDPGLVYSDIHAGDVVDAPVRVKAAQPGAVGEAIPSDERTAARKLDAARIAAIRSDTERVSSVLGEIFGAEETAEDATDAPQPAVLKGLDVAMTALVQELIEKTHLSDEAFNTLCKRHGLMAAGALEAINEWAFETYDDALLDEYDGYNVAPEIAAAVKLKFDKEARNVQTQTP